MTAHDRPYNAYSAQKIIHPDEVEALVKKLRASNKSIASINGSFDLLHAGHLHILYEASQCADTLLVALNSDSSIQSYKSPKRPIIALHHRLEMMAALGFVDYVTYFDEVDPCRILEKIQPDVHVNGAEYGSDCVEAETVKRYGGKIHLVDKIPGLSTSEIIEKIVVTCG